ncbi:hypothetical protein GGR51DRAFT_53809 [Nemania sp. FL0031]|nr:hypothetical protein GGR51DRAFT_53809 [Nemania sp. FL0031]
MRNSKPIPGTVTEARRLISQINKEKGFLSEEDLDRIGPPGSDTRRMVEDAILRKDELIGAGILTLAKNLYTSSARFVFELLQNADDNDFSRAIARREDPYVSFQVFPDRIILECNEDGFTSENLRAICALGQSSKVGARGYIGEKGIGFKSVFMAAWQVHIQSNTFSFTFTHRKGDSGMGMVSPVWREPEAVDASLTRITLNLHQHDDPAAQEEHYSNIINQFTKLQGTYLLFLRKLRRVQISFHDTTGIQTSHIEHSLDGTDRITIRTTSLLGGRRKVLKNRVYHVTKHVAVDIPANENRSYENEEQRADANTEIVLAFPLTEDSVPIDNKNQDVFAFLPVKKMGFKFLIHTDFVTEASRQDIVITSRRNKALRQGIAHCFIEAVKQFCQHPTLQFQWMRWLPRRDAYPWDDFWSNLLDTIDARVKTLNAFRCQTDNRLKTLSSLRILDHGHLDKAGNPLFRDLPSAIYLSQKYDNTDLKILKPLGLMSLLTNDIINIVSYDLRHRADLSHMKCRQTDDDWHSRTARLLLSCLKKGSKEQQQSILSLEILPLSTGEWSSITTAPLYYYRCEGGIEIPEGLDLKLVSPVAAENPERRALFDDLGVSTAPIRHIQDKIFSSSRSVVEVDLQIAISRLKYLYLSHYHKGAEIARERFVNYPLCSATGKIQGAQNQLNYLPTSGQHGTIELLRSCPYANYMIHDAYLKEAPSRPPGETLSWVDWLCQYLGIRRNLRLTYWDKKERCMRLSPEIIWMSDVRPERVVGALQTSWASHEKIFTENSFLVDRMKKLMVLDKHGEIVELGDTYLPLPELEESYSRFAEGEKFPFLQLHEPIALGTYLEKWGFLVTALQIGYREDLQFYLRVLEIISRAGHIGIPTKRPERFLDLYRTIQGSCETSYNRSREWDIVRRKNESCDLVFIPANGFYLDEMVSPNLCVWAGHENLRTRHPLEHLYRTEFNLAGADLKSIRQYFQTILEVPDCGWEHYTDEIRKLQKADDPDFDWINDIYHFIDEARERMLESGLDDLKGAFVSEPLIYADTNGSSRWHTISQCIWSSALQIRGLVSLNEVYSDLEEFFVDFLGVATLTLDMTYDELILKGKSDPAPPIQDVKATIFEFNSLLQTCLDSETPDPERLFGSKILPIRYPKADGQHNVKLVDGSTEFAIVDRELFHRAFASQVKLLDFTLEETRVLGPFINWLGLNGRYLSVVVKEISTVEYNSHSSRPLQNPERQIKNRAHGLLRIAMQNDSPRTEHLGGRILLYRTLCQAKVYETDKISSELHLSQDNKVFKYTKDISELHIRGVGYGDLEVYVPRDPARQELCYFAVLPPRLLDWLMTDLGTNIKASGSYAQVLDVINSALNAPVRSLSQILLSRGIVDVAVLGWYNGDEDCDRESNQSSEWESDQGITRNIVAKDIELPHRLQIGRRWRTEDNRTETRLENTTSILDVPNQDTPSPPSTQSTTQHGDELQAEYLGLLNHVIYRAALAKVSRQYIFSRNRPADAHSEEEVESQTESDTDEEVEEEAGDNDEGEIRRPLYSRIPLERDLKVGAAGELFVFKLLSWLEHPLPDFGRDNWQSTIRKFVTIHSMFADMEPWSGCETADIVYRDQSGAFTELLLDSGHLQGGGRVWRGKRPKYMIEVKTTTRSLETPFYMSRRQFQRMKEHTDFAASPLSSPTIYMVMRVFNVNKDNIGVKIYLDPEKLRHDGLLVFTELGYSVKPGKGKN